MEEAGQFLPPPTAAGWPQQQLRLGGEVERTTRNAATVCYINWLIDL